MQSKIKELVKKRRAIILAHNYQPPEVQDIADLCGDSLELSIRAAQTDAEVIVFCGVHFMAETASILSPHKKVLLPRPDVGCLMAEMVDLEELLAIMASRPPMPVVTYVNSTAAVKAVSTICCTSANAIKVVNSLKADELLMTPDKNLALYTAAQTQKKIHTCEGYCPSHDRLRAEDVLNLKKAFPTAVFMAHPECRPEVIALADAVRSTSGMIRYAGESDCSTFIVGTEIGLLYPLKKAHPDKLFIPAATGMLCKNMKKITLADIARSLEHMEGEVKVPEDIRRPAFNAVQRMIDLSL